MILGWTPLWFEKSKQTNIFLGEGLPVFYFDRISVTEGVDLESHQDYDNFIDETLSKICSGCRVIYNKSSFNHQERTCDRCYKMLCLQRSISNPNISFAHGHLPCSCYRTP